MSVMYKLEEVKKELDGLSEVMKDYGLPGESERLKKHITFLYEVIEDRTKDIMHLRKQIKP